MAGPAAARPAEIKHVRFWTKRTLDFEFCGFTGHVRVSDHGDVESWWVTFEDGPGRWPRWARRAIEDAWERCHLEHAERRLCCQGVLDALERDDRETAAAEGK
jgi:hypothetical protein